MRGGETDIQELIAEANAAERDRLERRIDRLEDQRREIVQEYEATRDALVEGLRPVRRRVENRSQSASEVRAEKRRLEEELREVRRRFRRERQEVERELVEARDALERVEEADAQVEELVEELS